MKEKNQKQNTSITIRPARKVLPLKLRIVMFCCALIVLLTALSFPVAFGWFYKSTDIEAEIETANFKADISVWFDYNGTMHPQTAGAAPLGLNIYDLNNINYVDNLRSKITFSGVGQAYCRVVIAQMWTSEVIVGYDEDGNPEKEKESVAALPLDMDVGDSWITYPVGTPSRYMYYYNPNAGAGVDPYLLDTDNLEIDLIKAVTFGVSDPPQNLDLHIRIVVSPVQKNRYKEIWGIDSLPTP